MALITWDQSSITMQAGTTATVRFYCGKEYEYLGTISTTDTGVATIVTQPVPGNDFAGDAVITAVSGGTVTTTCRSYDTQSAPLTITVESADDESYLNKRGLTRVWENIDTLKQDKLTAGNHIDITGNTIKAVDYVHSDSPVPTTAVTPVVTNNMIANGTITADKLATGATVKLTLSTSDIGEGTPLAANTLYGVYS